MSGCFITNPSINVGLVAIPQQGQVSTSGTVISIKSESLFFLNPHCNELYTFVSFILLL